MIEEPNMIEAILTFFLVFAVLIFTVGLIAGTKNDDEDKSK